MLYFKSLYEGLLRTTNPAKQTQRRLAFRDFSSSISRESFAKYFEVQYSSCWQLLTELLHCDLIVCRGSEKWHVNGSDLTDRYASELASINKSLSALTNCVMALTQKQRPHVPFRDSVLTRLLQPCLQGSGRTAFIVTISPSKGSLEESFATLRFAERLKAIRCRPIRRSLFSSEIVGEQRLYYERQIQVMRVSDGISVVLLRFVTNAVWYTGRGESTAGVVAKSTSEAY